MSNTVIFLWWWHRRCHIATLTILRFLLKTHFWRRGWWYHSSDTNLNIFGCYSQFWWLHDGGAHVPIEINLERMCRKLMLVTMVVWWQTWCWIDLYYNIQLMVWRRHCALRHGSMHIVITNFPACSFNLSRCSNTMAKARLDISLFCNMFQRCESRNPIGFMTLYSCCVCFPLSNDV